MNLVQHALRGQAPKQTNDTRPTVLVVGGGGPLGSAVLEHLLGGAFAHVRVLATQDLRAAVRGFEPVFVQALAAPADGPLADLAIVVFDRERHANGRDAAFVRPAPAELPALARTLNAAGVRDLLVVAPHTANALPQALREGLANLDEQAVAALGFAHTVFVRSAQVPPEAGSRGLQRVADLVLAQLRLMTPARLQPVRAAKVARFVAALARGLPAQPPFTRSVAPEWVWLAAQSADVDAVAQAWLAGRAMPEGPQPKIRM